MENEQMTGAPSAPTPSTESVQMVTPPTTGSGSTSKLVGIVIGLVALLVLAGGAYGAYMFLAPSENPEIVLVKMTEAMAEVESGSFDGQITLAVEGTDPTTGIRGEGEFTAKVEGVLDANDPENASFDIRAGAEGRVNSDETGEMNFVARAGVRYIPHTLYLQLEDLSLTTPSSDPESAFVVGMISGMAEVYKGKWIKVESTSPLEDQDLETVEHQQEIRAITLEEIVNHGAVVVTEDLGKEKVSGKNSYHYALEIDLDAMYDAILVIEDRLVEEDIIDETDRMSDWEKESLKGDLEELGISKVDIEVWVDTKDYYLRKVELVPYDIEIDEGFSATVSGVLVYDDFNEEFDIEEPRGAQSLEELFYGSMDNKLDY